MATLAVAAGAPMRPQLVVGIVIDGLEQDYIDLLRDSFGKGGFNRLLEKGSSFRRWTTALRSTPPAPRRC